VVQQFQAEFSPEQRARLNEFTNVVRLRAALHPLLLKLARRRRRDGVRDERRRPLPPRHLLAEARRHLTLAQRGRRRRDPGLDDRIVAAAISTYCLDISEPTTVRGLKSCYRLYTARWALSDLPDRRRPLTLAPDPDRRPPPDPEAPAAPRQLQQEAGE
jgi:hypothetical protein